MQYSDLPGTPFNGQNALFNSVDSQVSTATRPGSPGANVIFSPAVNSVTFNGVLTVSAGRADTLTDTVTQTPGPLPILGAGAAFGFTRKLRNRIKASA